MRKPTVDWLAGLAAVGAQWRACTAATRRRSRVGLVSGGSAWATSALCKLCMMGPVLMLHGLVLLLADGTVPEPPGMARVTGGELNLKYTPESGMLLAGSQWCAGAAPDSTVVYIINPSLQLHMCLRCLRTFLARCEATEIEIVSHHSTFEKLTRLFQRRDEHVHVQAIHNV